MCTFGPYIKLPNICKFRKTIARSMH